MLIEVVEPCCVGYGPATLIRSTDGRTEHMDFDDPIECRKWLARLVASAKARARKADMSFELPLDFADLLYARQNGCCAVTGLKFNLRRFPNALVKHPFAPSIDRRLSSGGYTEDNVRLVCVAVNFGMGQWGEEVFLTLARAAVDLETHQVSQPGTGPDVEWEAGYRERIAAAESLLTNLSEKEQSKQRRHIASLRRALTLGPHGLKAAADKAMRNRSGPRV
jgi:hypothetical protein